MAEANTGGNSRDPKDKNERGAGPPKQELVEFSRDLLRLVEKRLGPGKVDVRLDDPDKTKLHAEINLIGNQRLLLAAAALTALGICLGYIKDTAGSGAITSTEAAITTNVAVCFLQIILIGLFYYSLILWRKLRNFSTYLRVTKSSKFEQDWYEFRRSPERKRIADSVHRGHMVVFLGAAFIGLTTLGVPWLFPRFRNAQSQVNFSESLIPVGTFAIAMVLSALTLCYIVACGRRNDVSNEGELEKYWEDLLKLTDDSSPPKKGKKAISKKSSES